MDKEIESKEEEVSKRWIYCGVTVFFLVLIAIGMLIGYYLPSRKQTVKVSEEAKDCLAKKGYVSVSYHTHTQWYRFEDDSNDIDPKNDSLTISCIQPEKTLDSVIINLSK